VEVTGLSADSRTVRPGFLFAALPGARVDGRDFIPEALARGATAVLAPPGTRIEAGESGRPVTVITDPNPRRRFALMAARFFGLQPHTIAAVTGTNGKTSVAAFTHQIWKRLGVRAASLGTLGLAAPGVSRPGALTTPDPVELHRILAELAGDGVDHLVMEASSHGLDQYRLDGVRVTVAALTNVSRDHLDYHGDMEAYFAAKIRLFDDVMAAGGTAVLNADAPQFETVSAAAAARGHRIIGYGRKGAEIRLESLVPTVRGQRLAVSLFGQRSTIEIPLLGAFQASNALCALGLVLACGGEEGAALRALGVLTDAPGRMELVARQPNGAPIYVDYAHTPDALESVLSALRLHAEGRLVVVMGCGGDRDPGKRPLMAAIAGRCADQVVVTDDNPRSEDPAAIRRQIMAGVPRQAAAAVREIGGRAEAIAAAVAELEPGDLLVIAGKGHERGQIVGDEVLPFDDAEAARAAVAALGGDPA
jgi:UDP-N-acetylmuramoyl-L-alanyl-D-glutamate--2,6-diaminopimelate ligase